MKISNFESRNFPRNTAFAEKKSFLFQQKAFLDSGFHVVVGEAMEMMLCSQLSVESYYLHSFASKNFDGKATW